MGGAWAVIVAAGRGERFGSAKQFEPLGGKPLYRWSLEAFDRHEEVEGIVLVVPPGPAGPLPSPRGKLKAVVAGGAERQDSVRSGFSRVPAEGSIVVLVHDGARPLVSGELIGRVIAAARERGAAVPGLSVEDTIKEVYGGRVLRTVDRSSLVRVQTPQGFLHSVLREALELAAAQKFTGTDEAMLVERTGRTVALVEGDPKNIKVTTHWDIKVLEALIHE